MSEQLENLEMVLKQVPSISFPRRSPCDCLFCAQCGRSGLDCKAICANLAPQA